MLLRALEAAGGNQSQASRMLGITPQAVHKFLQDRSGRFKPGFLIELPTGTGKTDLTCLYLKRLIQAGRAERILFLVDREQLAKQAIEAIQDILNQYSSYWLRLGMVRQEQRMSRFFGGQYEPRNTRKTRKKDEW